MKLNVNEKILQYALKHESSDEVVITMINKLKVKYDERFFANCELYAKQRSPEIIQCLNKKLKHRCSCTLL